VKTREPVGDADVFSSFIGLAIEEYSAAVFDICAWADKPNMKTDKAISCALNFSFFIFFLLIGRRFFD
jgi:hypothetical protein